MQQEKKERNTIERNHIWLQKYKRCQKKNERALKKMKI